MKYFHPFRRVFSVLLPEGINDAAIKLGLFNLFGYILAFGKEVFVASVFGAGRELDAFFVSLYIITFVFSFISYPIEPSVVPEYIAQKKSLTGRADLFVGSTWGLVLLFSSALILLMGGLGKYLISYLAPGLDHAAQDMSRDLLFILLPSLLFNVLFSLGKAVLNAEKHFLYPAIASSVSPLIIITFVYVLPSWGIYGLAAGTMTAAFFQAFILYRCLKFKNIFYPIRLNMNSPGIKRIVSALPPLLLASGFTFVIPLVDRWFASSFPAGTITCLSYADKIIQILTLMAIYPVTTIFFPRLSELTISGSNKEIWRETWKKIAGVVLRIIPVIVLLLMAGKPIIHVLFERGAFSGDATVLTAKFLSGYAVGFIPFAIGLITIQVFLARKKTGFVAFVGGLNILMKILFNYILTKYWGPVGISLAWSAMVTITALVELVVFAIHVRRSIRGRVV